MHELTPDLCLSLSALSRLTRLQSAVPGCRLGPSSTESSLLLAPFLFQSCELPLPSPIYYNSWAVSCRLEACFCSWEVAIPHSPWPPMPTANLLCWPPHDSKPSWLFRLPETPCHYFLRLKAIFYDYWTTTTSWTTACPQSPLTLPFPSIQWCTCLSAQSCWCPCYCCYTC